LEAHLVRDGRLPNADRAGNDKDRNLRAGHDVLPCLENWTCAIVKMTESASPANSGLEVSPKRKFEMRWVIAKPMVGSFLPLLGVKRNRQKAATDRQIQTGDRGVAIWREDDTLPPPTRTVEAQQRRRNTRAGAAPCCA
jgi:hypothetical protein